MRGRAWARDEAEKAAIANAWYGEAFARTKRLPSLERLLSDPDADQSPEEVMEVIMALKDAGAEIRIEEVEAPPWEQQ